MSKVQALVVNCGSSSLKYAVFEMQPDGELEELCCGLVDKINLDGCVIKHELKKGRSDEISIALKDHGMAMEKVVELLLAPGGPVKDKAHIRVVGHRVVHGGDKFSEPTVVASDVMKALEELIPLAPLHNPANIEGVRRAQATFPDSPHVLVFDTAFHSTMPPESYRYAIPKELYTEHHVRRYGFHGTSYKYVAERVAEIMRQPLAGLNLIICHLGNGCSMACLKGGKVIDTTMGLTPLEGLMMGTRSGDIDAGVYTFLCNSLNKTAKEVDVILNKKSGLLGVAGTSDMRDVIKAAAEGNEDAVVARSMYVHRVRKYLGAYLVSLHGELDALVFTGGVGENDRGFRELAVEQLEPLGIELDVKKNKALKGEGDISSLSSPARVLVIPTREEYCIAQQSLEAVDLRKKLAPSPSTSVRCRGRPHSAGRLNTNRRSPILFVVSAAVIAACAVLVDRWVTSRMQ